MKKIILGTRGSQLALWQTKYILSLLSDSFPKNIFEYKIFKTSGDLITDKPLPKIGDKGLFTRELEEAMLRGEIDLAVHSLKDLPSQIPSGLVYAGSPVRSDPRDVFVSNKWKSIEELPEQVQIATGSIRRKAQLGKLDKTIDFKELRGNIDTRLRKLDEYGYDGIIMAAAALIRLDLSHRITQYLDTQHYVPSVAQGAIGIECRKDDKAILDMVQLISDPVTVQACLAERAFMEKLEGGCSVALGAYAQVEKESIQLRGFVSSADGSRILNEAVSGAAVEAESLGQKLAEHFIEKGARDILGS